MREQLNKSLLAHYCRHSFNSIIKPLGFHWFDDLEFDKFRMNFNVFKSLIITIESPE